MKKRPGRPSALSKVRAATGLTQRDFAARLGCSASAVEMAELGERAVSQSLAVKVMGLTGCDPDSLMLGKARDLRGREFTEQSFRSWTAKMRDPDLMEAAVGKTANLVYALLEDARTGGKDCLLPVLIGLTEAIDVAVRRFGLSESLRKRLRGEGQYHEWNARLLWEGKTGLHSNVGPALAALLK